MTDLMNVERVKELMDLWVKTHVPDDHGGRFLASWEEAQTWKNYDRNHVGLQDKLEAEAKEAEAPSGWPEASDMDWTTTRIQVDRKVLTLSVIRNHWDGRFHGLVTDFKVTDDHGNHFWLARDREGVFHDHWDNWGQCLAIMTIQWWDRMKTMKSRFHLANPTGKNTVMALGLAVVTETFTQIVDGEVFFIHPQTSTISCVTDDHGRPIDDTIGWAWAGWKDMDSDRDPDDWAIGFQIGLDKLARLALDQDGKTVVLEDPLKVYGFLRLQDGWKAIHKIGGPSLARFRQSWKVFTSAAGNEFSWVHLAGPGPEEEGLAHYDTRPAIRVHLARITEAQGVRKYLESLPAHILESIYVTAHHNEDRALTQLADDLNGITAWDMDPDVPTAAELNPGLARESTRRLWEGR